MSMKEIVDIVSKLSPIVGSALGGPVGGVIATLLAHVFGGAKDLSTLATNIQNDPEAQIKLKEIEQQIQANELGDLQSARNRDEKIVSLAASPNANFVVSFIALVPHMLVFLIGAAIVAILFLRIFFGDDTSDALIATILAQLFMVFMKGCNMYFGNNKNNS